MSLSGAPITFMIQSHVTVFCNIQKKIETYKLRKIIDDNQVCPGVFRTEVAFIIDPTKLANPISVAHIMFTLHLFARNVSKP